MYVYVVATYGSVGVRNILKSNQSEISYTNIVTQIFFVNINTFIPCWVVHLSNEIHSFSDYNFQL